MSSPILASLSKCAPSILLAVSPTEALGFFERIIVEGRKYKIAREQLQVQYAQEQGTLTVELEKLKAQKEVYLASIDSERRLIAEANKPTMEALAALFKDLNTFNEQSDRVLNAILEQVKEVEPDTFALLMGTYTALFGNRDNIYCNIQQTLEHSRKNTREQLAAINTKVLAQDMLVKR